MVSQTLAHGETQTQSVISARKLVLSGKVQGVGFRPFVFTLAKKFKLSGWVKNCMGTVEIFVQGKSANIDEFITQLLDKKPSLAKPKIESNLSVEKQLIKNFSILPSQQAGNSNISLPVDMFLCEDCLREMNDPTDRRYLYPFINCTQCGPRYTLIKNLPYDRANTSMAEFELCAACCTEYENPEDRRFHAEPIACPECGPSLSFKSPENHSPADTQHSLLNALDVLNQGKVLAVKGIGGYHLMCDATNTDAIERLRKNKSRPHKPLAVMFPAPADNPFQLMDQFVSLSEYDKDFLLTPSRPILLAQKNNNTQLSDQLSPALGELGVMLPYSPLHHLILNRFNKPLVASSANISGEPVLIKNHEVESRLKHIADAFLHHDREIEQVADDPVYRSIAHKPRPLRLGRGVAPVEIRLPFELAHPVLALGAQMKNTVTLAWGNRAVISPHIGEMHTPRSFQVFEKTLNDLQRLYDVKAQLIVCDAHPAYTTSRWADKQKLPVYKVFHHHAHASASYFEANTHEDMLVFTWDGTGYGDNGSLWGGEALLGKPGAWKRVASMRPFNLPGGDKAGREPWRSAAAICWETGKTFYDVGVDHQSEYMQMLKLAWQKKINSPQSSSVGRLFDAAAALCGARAKVSYEGQAAMELESLCEVADTSLELPLSRSDGCYISDWEPLIEIMQDISKSISQRVALFHGAMATSILLQAKAVREESGMNCVGFSGGVFQNKILTESAIRLLEKNDFKVTLPVQIPLNDAGISFGQVIETGFNQ